MINLYAIFEFCKKQWLAFVVLILWILTSYSYGNYHTEKLTEVKAKDYIIEKTQKEKIDTVYVNINKINTKIKLIKKI